MGKKRRGEEEEELEEKFFGRDPRFFYGRKDPHTLRKVQNYRNERRSISAKVNQACNWHSRGDSKIPVTEIDNNFDDAFVAARATSGRTEMNNHVIDYDEEESFLQAKLEEVCVHKRREYRKYDGYIVCHYDVPIESYQQRVAPQIPFQNFIGNDECRRLRGREEAKTGINLQYWPYLNGKFWDPSYLYLIQSDGDSDPYMQHPQRVSFKPLFPKIGSALYNDIYRLGWTDGGLYRLNSCTVPGGRPNQKRKRGQTLTDGYLEIDLKAICTISHIGTLGGYPNSYKSHEYPSIYHQIDETTDCINATGRKPFGRRTLSISTVPKSALDFVTQYTIEYQHPEGKVWFPLGKVFQGNVKVHEEVLQKVAIRARHIRFRPLQLNGQLNFTVFLYGHSTDGQRYADSLLNADVAQSVKRYGETVRYTMTPSQFKPYRHDGCGHHGNGYDYSYGDNTPWKRKEHIKRIIVEDRRLEESETDAAVVAA